MSGGREEVIGHDGGNPTPLCVRAEPENERGREEKEDEVADGYEEYAIVRPDRHLGGCSGIDSL